MKYFITLLIFQIFTLNILFSQHTVLDEQIKEIYTLIDQYSQARDNQDTVLLKIILTDDVDQLVSSGEWRIGIRAAVAGMMSSSKLNPGDRKLIVEKIRLMDPEHGIVDARYEISEAGSRTRKMWSTFLVVFRENRWKITGIRNMLPTG